MMTMKAKLRTAFTLVEMLVVVAIIVILMTLLVPGMSAARRRAGQVVCLTRVRAWGVGLQGYLADSGGVYPNRRSVLAYWLGKAGKGGYGADGLQADDRPLNEYVGGPYAPTAEVPEAQCPLDKTTRVYLGTPRSMYEEEGASYQANIPLSSPGGRANLSYGGLVKNEQVTQYIDGVSVTMTKGRRTSEVADGSRMVTIAEVGAYVASWWPASTWISGGQAYNWHDLNSWNISFADGGARSVRVIPQSFTNELYSFHYQY